MLQKLFGLLDDGKLQPGEEELIGTRFFGEEDFEDVPSWIQEQIKRIYNKGLGDSPEDLTHELVGRTFIYRLDFDGPNGEILGVYRALKAQKSVKQSKAKLGKAKSAKTSATPSWQLLGSRYEPNLGGASHKNWDKVPTWVREKIAACEDYSLHYLNGKRYRYKIEYDYGQGNYNTFVYRRPRNVVPTPSWRPIGKKVIGGGSGSREFTAFKQVPLWVQKEIQKILNSSSIASVYRLKGRRYRYKVNFEYLGHGNWTIDVHRKMRMRYWKKLTG